MVPHEVMMMQQHFLMQQHMIQQQQQLVGGHTGLAQSHYNTLMSTPPSQMQEYLLPRGQGRFSNIFTRTHLTVDTFDKNLSSLFFASHHLTSIPSNLTSDNPSRSYCEVEMNSPLSLESRTRDSLSVSLSNKLKSYYHECGESVKMTMWPWNNIWSLGDCESHCTLNSMKSGILSVLCPEK